MKGGYSYKNNGPQEDEDDGYSKPKPSHNQYGKKPNQGNTSKRKELDAQEEEPMDSY